MSKPDAFTVLDAFRPSPGKELVPNSRASVSAGTESQQDHSQLLSGVS
jgi:hypothetical protein